MIYAYAFDKEDFRLGLNLCSDVYKRRFKGACGLLFICQQTHLEVFNFLFKKRIFDMRWFYVTIGGAIARLGGHVCGSITVLRIADFQLREDHGMAALILYSSPNLARLHMVVYRHVSGCTRAVVNALREGEVEVLCETPDITVVGNHRLLIWWL